MSGGIFNVGSFQGSGHPFLTGSSLNASWFTGLNSQTEVTFPAVAKSVTVVNTTTSSVSLRIHYQTLVNTNVIGGHHYITLTGSSTSVTLNSKCKQIFVSLSAGSLGDGSFEMYADLSTVSPTDMYALSGSGITN